MYFTVQTLATVGYGDVNPANNLERCYIIFLMLTGVVTFATATGSLGSLIQNFDAE